ncbi:protein dispatched homolog 1 isoform X1 [Nerophis lumbriciformis]|uniref:protein dispatched homolog 1 isoform X1 n=1 Tax=Nerophis lumbriciformis TaxID=546530 RepID=UPI002ADFCCB1|nr:protein dispatched homolog 1-like [Nerophis lumbriciformis]XP_061781069.1 protein dispatched homolog 1-like [Nerophis lumbriciformis]XP_061781070.1 protein dispatched homolog 1-like [Nerophis lumbriciformis]XP_061781071.1 protein dispatched homolog 1-like [Nerophis lumbriciformis]
MALSDASHEGRAPVSADTNAPSARSKKQEVVSAASCGEDLPVHKTNGLIQNGGVGQHNGAHRTCPLAPPTEGQQLPVTVSLSATSTCVCPSHVCCQQCSLCCPLLAAHAPGTASCSCCNYSRRDLHHHQHLKCPPRPAGLTPTRPFRFPKSYSELIADWPVVVLGVCTLLIVVCALVGVLVPDLPDFSDPLLGFEPRGTPIGQRLVTWNNMVKNTGYKATLANYPFKYADQQAKSHQEAKWSEDHVERERRQAQWDFRKDFFCDVPGSSYSRLVFSSAEGKNLWSIQAIKSMCNLDNTRVRSHRDYWSLCQRTNDASCCPSWTLGNYIAVLANRSSCQVITERDVSHTLKILRSCAKYYHNGTLAPDCWDVALKRKDQLKCGNVPRKCTKYNAVYQILHFLVDKDFLSPKSMEAPVLRYSMLFSPTEKGESMMDIYLDNFEKWNSSDGITTVTGIEFGIKHELFQDYLLTDTVYPAIAMVIVLLVMCLYTRSVFITLMTIIAIISSLIVSYFLYRLVFNFHFFPFMNLTALIILVGIGADDAFVLCDVWNYTKVDKPDAELAEMVSVTLQHAASSMFVTSFTTAAAFYVNYVSNITAIRCFGVYAGTAILVNYILMVTWLPAVVVLHERYLPNVLPCPKPSRQRGDFWIQMFLAGLCQKANTFLFRISEASRIFFEKVLPCLVIKLRYLWLLWFLGLAVGGAYVVCVNPKMKLPSLELAEFQVFRSSHPFERYDAEYKKVFMFERVHHGEDLHMPITIIWGINNVDNGDPLNPKNKGKLMLDSSFNIASPDSQLWILNFCQKLRNQTFIFQSDEQDFTSCFMETFKQWMDNQDCEEASVFPCCSQSVFPYKQDVFELCIKRAIMELDRSTNYHLDSKTPGPRFDINDTIRAIVLQFHSTFLFTLAYDNMHRFFYQVDAWISEELRHAPAGLSHGWFVSNLDFFDLQDSLSDGTLVAMALSVGVAFSVMLLTTWNVIISLYAILSIAGTIFVTVGSLVLLGWELNVLESVTISVAVGLAVDFAVHYGVAYRLAPESEREGKVIFSLSRMGSAIAMAALTTFIAGAMMMPSTVLAYTQLGTFMMLIMCISWAFATFFFQSLCRCLGPQGAWGQIPLPAKCRPFSRGTEAGARGKYRLDAGHAAAQHYELAPLASSRNAEEDEELWNRLLSQQQSTPACDRLLSQQPNSHTCNRLLSQQQSTPACDRLLTQQPSSHICNRLLSQQPSSHTCNRLLSQQQSNTIYDRLLSQQPSSHTCDRLFSQQQSCHTCNRILSQQQSTPTCNRLFSQQQCSHTCNRLLSDPQSSSTCNRLLSEQHCSPTCKRLLSEQQSSQTCNTLLSEQQNSQTCNRLLSEHQSSQTCNTLLSEQQNSQTCNRLLSEQQSSQTCNRLLSAQKSSQTCKRLLSEQQSSQTCNELLSQQQSTPTQVKESTCWSGPEQQAYNTTHNTNCSCGERPPQWTLLDSNPQLVPEAAQHWTKETFCTEELLPHPHVHGCSLPGGAMHPEHALAANMAAASEPLSNHQVQPCHGLRSDQMLENPRTPTMTRTAHRHGNTHAPAQVDTRWESANESKSESVDKQNLPKKLSCLKVNSVSDLNLPKSERSFSPVVINSRSSQSLC